MHEKERIGPHFNHSADDLVAEQWLILHPSSTNFSTSNLFEHVNNETYSKIFLSPQANYLLEPFVDFTIPPSSITFKSTCGNA
jgi:hypothetical protein